MGFFDTNTISTDLNFIIPNVTLYHFGVLTSNVHMAWMRAVCGRLKSDYRYSKDVVYNNFPWPTPTAEQKAKAPKLEISATELNLGSFNGKKKLKGLITLTNKGKSELDIRSMQMFTMGLQVSLKKSKIQPGETVKMKVTAVAAELKKSRVKTPRILMITNDPDQAKVVVKIHVK